MTTGPTVRRRRLGTELRKLRESNGYKLEEVAAQLGVAPSTLSRIETGKAPTKSAYLNQMLEMYGVIEPGQRQVLVDMAREGHRKGWWAAYDDVLPSGFDIYVGLEAETAAVRGYEISVVHGLLQTPDYARAVLREMFPRHGLEQIDRLVDLRIERQRRLDDDPPIDLWAILDEAVIRRVVGGPDVMRAQLQRLKDLNKRPNVSIRIARFNIGAYVGMKGGFTVFEFPYEDDDYAVLIEYTHRDILVQNNPEEAAGFVETFYELESLASPATETDEILDEILAKLAGSEPAKKGAVGAPAVS